jgi:hypothetical protein
MEYMASFRSIGAREGDAESERCQSGVQGGRRSNTILPLVFANLLSVCPLRSAYEGGVWFLGTNV